jgi:hypothetical protein
MTHSLVAQIRAEHAAANTSGLSRDQLNFLALHVKRFVVVWQWVFRGAMLRASSERRSIAIRRAELDELISRGLMFKGDGAADVHPTADGKALVT